MDSIPTFILFPVEDLLREQNGNFYIGHRKIELSSNNLEKAIKDLKEKFPYTSPSTNTLHKIIRASVCHVCGEYKGSHQAAIGEYPSKCPHFEITMCNLLNLEGSYVNFIEEMAEKTQKIPKDIHLSILHGKGYAVTPTNSFHAFERVWTKEAYNKWLEVRLCSNCKKYHFDDIEWCRHCISCGDFHSQSVRCLNPIYCSFCKEYGHSSINCNNTERLRKVALKLIQKHSR